MHRERKHIRLFDWDYSSEGVYYITICCQDRHFFFDKICCNAESFSWEIKFGLFSGSPTPWLATTFTLI